MVRKVTLAILVALVVPALALAAKPSPPGKSQQPHGKAAPKVLYILKGTLSAYTAATSTADGTISIVVKHSNRHAKALRTTTPIAFTVKTGTKVVIANGRTFKDGDVGIVKVRAAKLTKNATAAEIQAALQAEPALKVIDQHAAPTP